MLNAQQVMLLKTAQKLRKWATTRKTSRMLSY